MDHLQFEFKNATVSEDGTFEGLGSTPTVDSGGDSVLPTAFDADIAERGNVRPMLWQHNQDEPIGSIEVFPSPKGLRVKGRLVLEVQRAREAYALLKQKAISGLSIGYMVTKDRMKADGRIIESLKLYEISVVSFPMNEEARIAVVKQQEAAERATLQAVSDALTVNLLKSEIDRIVARARQEVRESEIRTSLHRASQTLDRINHKLKGR